MFVQAATRWAERMTLTRKAAILCGIPLACQFLFVFALFVSLAQTETELSRAEFARQVLGHTNTITKSIAGLTGSYYNISEGQQQERDFAETSRRVQNEYSQLQTLLKDDPVSLAAVNSMKALMDRCIMYADESAESILAHDPQRLKQNMSKMRGLSLALVEQFETFSASFEVIASAMPESQSHFRAVINGMIVIFLVFNTLVVLLLFAAFNKSTITRLQRVIENTDRFARGQPLLPLVAGKDEIGTLDNVFHEMSAKIEEAAKQRQAVVNMVAHDVRSPIASIQISLESVLAIDAQSIPANSKSSLSSCLSSIHRLTALINDFLDSDKIATGKLELHREDFPAALLFESAVAAVRGLAELESVRIACPDSEIEVFGDPDRLTQVLVNLLSNALKFSPKDGTIEVQIDQTNERTEISVLDQGPGIPPDKIVLLFSEFSQLDNNSKRVGSSGLGLSICKKLVELHGGTIGVENRSPSGSRFWFTVPSQQYSDFPPNQRACQAQL